MRKREDWDPGYKEESGFKQQLPKKVLLTRRLPIRRGYECMVSFWIGDRAYSKERPAIAMTISHGRPEKKQRVRMVFESFNDVRKFLAMFGEFVLKSEKVLTEMLAEAEQEWLAMRDKVFEAKVSQLEKKENGGNQILS